MDSHCISGSIATGNPVGSYMTIADRKVYVSGPDDTQGKGIIFLTDAFGIEAINNRLLADAYAKGANVKVYMPDLFDEKPAPIELLKGLSAVPFDFRTFLSTNSRERRYPQVMAVVNELKESYGIKELVAAGFCFGAGICTQLSRDGLVAAFVVAHPSLLEIPQDIEAIKTVRPLLYFKILTIAHPLSMCRKRPCFF